MNVMHLNQRQLAERWQVSEATLERWRCVGLGPTYLKLRGRVVYRRDDIEDFERQCERVSTSERAHPHSTRMPSQEVANGYR